jgi:glycosyltransferase involved in cell wall biosynthesis
VVEGETGFIVPVGDDNLMAERIIQLLKDPKQARSMGIRGREVVEDKFSCASLLARMEGLYQDLLTRAHRAPDVPKDIVGDHGGDTDGIAATEVK